MSETTILQGSCGKIKPYTRGALSGKGGRSIRTPAGVKYDISQRVLAEHLFFSWVKIHSPASHGTAFGRYQLHRISRKKTDNMFDGLLPDGRESLIETPFRFGLAVCAPPVKSGPNKGHLPSNRGDHDNYTKAFLDAGQHCYLLPEDCLRWYRGPCSAQVKGLDRLRGEVYLSDEWRMFWRFEAAEDVNLSDVWEW